jgi:hypothetical protein
LKKYKILADVFRNKLRRNIVFYKINYLFIFYLINRKDKAYNKDRFL